MDLAKISALNFFNDLTSSYARRRFFTGFALIVVVGLLLAWIVRAFAPESIITDIIDSVVVEVVAGAIIVLAFYFLYVRFIGPSSAASDVAILRPQDISAELALMRKDVDTYMFWGRSGSFFRAVPLREMDIQSRDSTRDIIIDLLLPDPNDTPLVDAYCSILRNLQEEPGTNPLLPSVLATCMACAIVSANNKHMRIRIFVSKFLPTFRVDLSNAGAILTQDDPARSALKFAARSEFHNLFRKTILTERDLSREITWDKSLFAGLKLEEASCTPQTMNAFNFTLPPGSDLQREVARLIKESPHRYK